jgi:hypothetical protein
VDLQCVLQTPFVQVALPVLVTFVLAFWHQKKRIDDVNRRIDEVIKGLDRIDAKLDTLTGRVTRLEERTSPLISRWFSTSFRPAPELSPPLRSPRA